MMTDAQRELMLRHLARAYAQVAFNQTSHNALQAAMRIEPAMKTVGYRIVLEPRRTP